MTELPYVLFKRTLAPNSTRLARFWTDLATSVRVRPAAEDGGSGGGDRSHTVYKRHTWQTRSVLCFYLADQL